MSDNLGTLISRVKANKDPSDFARLLSALERAGIGALKEKEILHPCGFAPRIGITGPPGAGKSTLMSALVKHWVLEKKRVGVIAVDPSSPHSHGAILGDRIRYGDWITDPNVFVRSLGTRGSLGGLSSAVYLMLRAFDLFEFDIVLIETVGVGQTEVEIMNAADLVALVLVPESGDSIQAMKSGLLEVADVVIVNKSDRPGADTIKHEIENELLSRHETNSGDLKKVDVFSTVATSELGVKELAKYLFAQMDMFDRSERNTAKRLQSEAKALLRQDVENYVNSGLLRIQNHEDMLVSLEKAHVLLNQPMK